MKTSPFTKKFLKTGAFISAGVSISACSVFVGKGALSSRIKGLGSKTEILQASVLELGSTIAIELEASLVKAGLTGSQAAVVAEAAKEEVAMSAGTIVVASLNLAGEPKPITYAATPVVRGAIGKLGASGVGLTDLTRRAAIAKVVMTSTFSSLSGRVSDLDTADVIGLQKNMVGGAMKSLNNGGLAGDTASIAIKSVTAGAVEAIGKSLGKDNLAEGIGSVVAGAVENLNSDGLKPELIGSMIKSAAGGASTSLTAAGVTDATAAVTAVAKMSISSLKGLGLSDDRMLEASSGAAAGAVGGLPSSGVAGTTISDLAKTIATASVAILKDAGFADSKVQTNASSIAAGAIKGLSDTGLTATQIAETKVVGSIIAGAGNGLSQSIADKSAITAGIGAIAQSSVAAVSTVLSGANAGADTKLTVMGHIIDGSAQGIATAKMTASDSLTALSLVAQKSVEALPQSGFGASSQGDLAATMIGAGISAAINQGLGAKADAANIAMAVGAAVGAGAVKANIPVTTTVILAKIADAATAANLSNASSVMTSAISGTASGAAIAAGSATNVVMTAMQAAVGSSSTFTGLTTVDTSALAGSLSMAMSSATTLATSAATMSSCSSAFPDGDSTSVFLSKVKTVPQPAMCKRTTAVCPIPRDNQGTPLNWQPMGTTDVCQLLIGPSASTATAAIITFPACSQYSAYTTIESYKPFFSPMFQGVPCSIDSQTSSCPSLPPDAPTSDFSWSVITVAAANDTCLLTKVNQNIGNNFAQVNAVTCDSVGATNGFGLAALQAMTVDPNDQRSSFCKVPAGSACPVASGALSQQNFMWGPDMWGNNPDGTVACHYKLNAPSCTSYFGATLPASLTYAQISSSIVPEQGPYGDLSCYVGPSASCPTAPTLEYNLFTSPNAGVGVNVCNYTRKYATCPTTAMTLSETALATYFSVSDHDKKTYACNSTQQMYLPINPQNFTDAGFDQPVWQGMPNGTRMALRLGGIDCAALAITPSTSITQAQLNSMPNLSNNFSYSCDMPVSSSCPSLDASVSGTYYMTSTVFTGIGINRCLYSMPQPACSATANILNTAQFSSMPSMRTKFSNGHVFACDVSTGTCPSLPTGGAAFAPGQSYSATSLTGHTSGLRCEYSTAAPLCSDIVGGNSLIGNLWSMSGSYNNNQSTFECDVPGAATTCPGLDTTVQQGYTMSAPVSILGGAMKRCVATVGLPSCSTALSGATTITGTAQFSGLSPWTGGGINAPVQSSVGCTVPNTGSCPSLAIAGNNSYKIDQFNQNTLGVYQCIYSRGSAVGQVTFSTPNPNSVITGYNVNATWSPAAFADTYDYTLSASPACSTPLPGVGSLTNLTATTASLNLPGGLPDGTYYICVTGRSNDGTIAPTMSSSPFFAHLVPGPISTTSIVSPSIYTVTHNTAATVTIQAKDSYNMNLTTGGATITLSATSGYATFGPVTDNGNGTYTATMTAGSTFPASLNITATISGVGSIQSSVVTIN